MDEQRTTLADDEIYGGDTVHGLATDADDDDTDTDGTDTDGTDSDSDDTDSDADGSDS